MDYLPTAESFLTFLGVIVVAAPLALVFLLGISSLLGWQFDEQTSNRSTQTTVVSGLLSAIVILVTMLILDRHQVPIPLGDWVVLPGEIYHFKVKFVFDRLSVPFAILSYVLAGTIGAFASRYMHRERGYNRFFMLYALFMLGMVITALAGTIETLFTGWELVGLSSALLVAFFQDRPSPARNGLWVWVIYRVSDAALLLAAVVMHQMPGKGDLETLLGEIGEANAWPFGVTVVSEQQALLVGMLFLVAAAGKSGLVPFSGWLPRAMEGPTPSSAVFYGALSVHLGAFLLLRISPLLAASLWLSIAVVVLGLTTAVFAYLAASVQTDIKSALSFASLSQVGIIVAEIGLGLHYIPLIHMLGHACMRTLQFVRAPTLLQDYKALENAIGNRLPRPVGPWDRLATSSARTWLYRLALERGYLDTFLADYIVGPFVRLFRWCDAMERAWTDLLTGRASRASDQVKPRVGAIEELS
jgi:NAD(P)H-quinone oxidoreductase subunit 5